VITVSYFYYNHIEDDNYDIVGVMFYAIGRELLSNESPSGVYANAFKICQKNSEVLYTILRLL
jgi:TIM21